MECLRPGDWLPRNFCPGRRPGSRAQGIGPGTDDYFYYHALQAQNTGQRERFQEVIDRWVRERNGRVMDGARELLNRQALLDYDKDPQKTLRYLREQLDLHFDHARKTGERRSDAPTKFDNSQVSVEALLKLALARDKGSLERIENAGLELAAGQLLTGDQRRNLLARLERPDLPGPRGPDPGRPEVTATAAVSAASLSTRA